MTLSATLLERIPSATTNVVVPSADIDTVICSDTPRGTRIDTPTQPLLITRYNHMSTSTAALHPLTGLDHLLGTVQMVRGANTTHQGWILPANDANGRTESTRVWGAPLNPEMRDQHFYRIVASEYSQNYVGSVIQYRPGTPIPYFLLRRGDRLPVTGPDGWQDFDSYGYVEVVNPDGPATLEDLLDEDSDLLDPEPVGIPTDMPLADLERHVQGYVERTSNERVLLNPEPVVGQTYAVLGEEGYTDYAAVRVSDDTWYRIGNLTRWGFETEYSQHLPFEPRRWAAMYEYTIPTDPGEQQNTVTRLNAETERLNEQFTGFIEALNEMKIGHGWCGEYEEVMERGGMSVVVPPQQHAYDIDVRVTFDFTGNPSSARLDEVMGDEWDIDNCDISEVTFTAQKTVTIEGVVAEDEEGARVQIDGERVREELDSTLDFEADNITGWHITNIDEDENYDFS